MRVRVLLIGILSGALNSCGGGGSPEASSADPLPKFTITTQVDAGMSISPGTMSVEKGTQAVLTATSHPDFWVKDVQGCGGTFRAPTFTTGPITENCTVIGTSKHAYALTAIRLIPNALFKDEFSNAPVRIEAAAKWVGGLRLTATFARNWFDKNLPNGSIEVPLHDDGTHGDLIAGDGIYSAIFSTGMIPRLRFYEKTVDRLRIFVTARDEAGTFVNSDNNFITSVNLGVVDRVLTVPSRNVGEGIYAAPNMVNIVMPFQRENTIPTLKKFYQHYPDVFDGFALHLLGGTELQNIPGGAAAQNSAQGIRIVAFDSSNLFGSGGKLKSVVTLSPDIIGEIFNHEIGHSWAFFLNYPELDLTSGTGYHLGITSQVGVMGNQPTLQQQPGGDFLLQYAPDSSQYWSRQFSELELYLMGLLGPQHVAPQFFITDPAYPLNFGASIPRARVKQVTIDDVIRVYGPRVPSADVSQKSFRFVFIALSETPATPAEIAIINRVATYFASDSIGAEVDDQGPFPIVTARPFKSATRGLGELITAMPNPK